MNEVCFVCGRKANRRCPVGSALEPDPGVVDESIQVLRPICSGCCGKGRRRTIDCPDECPHFRAGARAALIKLVDLSRYPDFEWRHSEVLHNLRLGVTVIRRKRLTELKDAEARQAFANAADTMRTRASGLIYNFRSPDPRVQVLSDELITVARLHERGEKGMAKTDAATLMQCLKYLERQAAAAEKVERGASYFLDLAVQSVTSAFVTREPEGLVGRLTEDEEGDAILDLGRLDSTEIGEERTQSRIPASE